MAKHVVVVESPGKSKTIQKYLGRDFVVLASYGHVRDLVPKDGAVDTEHGFAMQYTPIEKNQARVDAIANALKKADSLYLATDPDREGEAISWHLCALLEEQGALKGVDVHRIAFNQVTRNAVQDAVAAPRTMMMDLVHAQQARRGLDFLYGFNLSPLLWQKIRRGLSAGRVQSPALRMIVEREEAIAAFERKEYWSIVAHVEHHEQKFDARLITYDAEKLTQFSVTQEDQATDMRTRLLETAQGVLRVEKVEKKQRKRNPAAPFTTATLQQEAGRKLGFTTSRTMRIAQQLYEGIDVGEGEVGLITYMRTDSVHLATEAVDEMRAVITQRYGADYLPKAAKVYKTKARNAQEAHEAVRPTTPSRIPDTIKSYLSAEQYKLYDLIWKRSIACQMMHALIDTVSADLSCGKGAMFRANGSAIAHPGFLTVYEEGVDDGQQQALQLGNDAKLLPELKQGEQVQLHDIVGNQHFTEPPPRYTEASLVKSLEAHGIGRPSTYASIIATLQNREYVLLDQKRFYPTDVGTVVKRFLMEYFTQYVDYDFTAKMEDELDAVARGEKAWTPVLEHFWAPFHARVQEIHDSVDRKEVTQEKMDEACPECGQPLSIRLGRNGRFVGCTAYPDCRYTRDLEDAPGSERKEDAVVEGRVCPECEAALVIKRGRYGTFIGCSGYPDCRYIEPLEKPEDTEVECPACHKGTLLQRKSRRGKIFYSCAQYPDCRYAVWDRPLKESCPECQWPILTIKTTKRRGTEHVCPQKECTYAVSCPDESVEDKK